MMLATHTPLRKIAVEHVCGPVKDGKQVCSRCGCHLVNCDNVQVIGKLWFIGAVGGGLTGISVVRPRIRVTVPCLAVNPN